ncbi:acyl carrier protein [Variovorax sp. J2P1-59]|uniref:acyl carrier protein n=1 Tax=Variovorax flavidus TaxID=3053501 RepID=UPI00257498A2|nr:acyl carrier protein [Variovorax sp. J2P1-59]MDM0077524.1 acyl carrier protein [Variovorax sp. J2P1-59]
MIDKDTLSQLTDHVMKTMERDTIDPDVAIGELGFDSMRVVELIMICDQIYGTAIDPEAIDLNQYTTLRDIDSQFRALALQGGGQKR